ncbi:RNA polymerase sigma factor [Pelagicoccus sp. SDUM812005]|uniref:RNA polymerase sigma factor n=1 Tax=Pelagicoccus sp. SDUM812005 TaxID=3041257 RepID=UPI00280C66BD|nr:RNA polymerase sigma factor [Pelagicoccus sp. SDUM812005]MDQ8181699.1 RNA polymerase sigma factor [Pelagicoccus sp. SDUM812005]
MPSDLSLQIEAVYRAESGKVLATLARLLGDIDLAEEALQEAFVAALKAWRRKGIPAQPAAWLISTGRFKAIDAIRKRSRLHELEPELQARIEDIQAANLSFAERDIQDDRLRLIFACCHPAIDPSVQVPLTLREVCGLSTEDIAAAFLVPTATMAQRIVRGKSKIRAAKIPFAIPDASELPERLDSVLSVVYLVFNEGYSASSGDSALRGELSQEAIRLARLLLQLLPDSEVKGLLALMLLHESRRTARTDARDDIVLLEDQDRRLWDRGLIEEGLQLVQASLATQEFGFYTVQAAISAVHAESPSSSATDWAQIVALYNILLQIDPSPVVELNRAVAVAMRDGPQAGLEIVDTLFAKQELRRYHLAHSARGELLRRLGQESQAESAFLTALSLAKQEPERRFLQRRLQSLGASESAK